MTVVEAVYARHSVRKYLDRAIEPELVRELRGELELCGLEGGLRFELVTDEPLAFGGLMARYGSFSGVKNYIALIGGKSAGLDERIGYYGERAALKAQTLGLNTCWVALTYSKGKCAAKTSPGERLVCVLSLGYGATQGVRHKSRPLSEVCRFEGTPPDWFRAGAELALLAPTATNQQRFLFTLLPDNYVEARSTGGFYSGVDLGIVKYHFELGAGAGSFKWTPQAGRASRL